MPPYVPRKRLRASSPEEAGTPDKSASEANSKAGAARKRTLYDDLDSSHTPGGSDSLLHDLGGSGDSDSPLSSLSDSDFEDVPLAKRQKTDDADVEEDDDEDDDDDIEFEDVEAPTLFAPDAPAPSGDLELTLIRDTRISLTNQFDKKGPSKRERTVRNATHCVHVLCLLWHNAVRNSWICDPEVQAIMISHVPPRLWDEVDRWRQNSGLVPRPPPPKKTAKKKGAKQDSRDWGDTAKRLEEGAVDMSHGDPLFRLMKSLVAWWKQRFRVAASGLRKWGYMSLERLDRLTKAYKEHEADFEEFGERIEGIEGFRQCAIDCRGSRDVGAQLFTALLRGLGIDARMVASLQPLGFGWNKLEDANTEEVENNQATPTKTSKKATAKKPEKKETEGKAKGKTKTNNTPSRSRSAREAKKLPAVTQASEDDLEPDFKDTDDESVDMTLTTPTKSLHTKKFDTDLEFPHYWTEILSPVTKKYLAVDPIVKGTIATNRDLIETFEPRGAKADRARQVIAYVVGYSGDGTAKDVTVRYLKRQVLPGRTKGVRMPPVKMPVYNRHGKVKRYELSDWFKTAMSGYRRGGKHHPLTEVDQQEDLTDLKPAKAEKKEVREGEETLQYYKQSKHYALERHLKREEALRPGAKPVKVFKNKGKGGKVDEEDVYLRSDVVLVKSAETWHKQGRAPLAGEQPLKRVPYRAATLNRKREILETEAMTGQKVLQGLYSFDQTDWIIPPPIKDGVIPKNEYGNIDLFAEHMCPEGAVHVPFRGVGKVCKRLGIDYAEAVVDFEFGHRMAVPVIQGVVIAKEHHDRVMAELEKDEAERVRKEDEKRRKAALGMWRKFLMGMRIVERIRQEYGEIDDSVSVFSHARGGAAAGSAPKVHDEEFAGGFLPEGYEEDGEDGQTHETSSFFPALDEDDQGGMGDLVMEDGRDENVGKSPPEVHLETSTKSRNPSARSRTTRATRKKKQTVVDEDDEEDGDWEG
ncbi:Rad4 domain-containing protein [Trichoderma longibrachiatum]|uniref:Rad4-domain-containing protein n=1 Tax=Trichoderma longibrachiatum ATCC 18648 TaxID=983965 RepID=A0A2T4C4H9_TRILO|nr:Rad4-domain-containing protein [Trichoderma longibrachiatum ATCC 18648]